MLNKLCNDYKELHSARKHIDWNYNLLGGNLIMAFTKEKVMDNDKKWVKILLADELNDTTSILPYEWLADKENDIYFFILSRMGRGDDLAMSPEENVRLIFNKKDIVYINAWIRGYGDSKRASGKVELFIVPDNLNREYVLETLQNALEMHFVTQELSGKLLKNLRNIK